MAHKIEMVKTEEQIELTATLAKEIWTEHYTPIIGIEQVKYMLTNMQSATAITNHISNNYQYYLAYYNNQPSGYFAIIENRKENSLTLSKIYVSHKSRNTGTGCEIMNFTKEKALTNNASKISLTVNKHNHNSINWYKKRGFKITEDIINDIGNGFYMDDYILELTIAK